MYDWSTGLVYKHGNYFDPSLGIWLALTPLVVAQARRRRKKGSKSPWILLVGLFLVGTGAMLAGCGGEDQPTVTCTEVPTPTGLPTPTWVPTATSMSTPTGTPTLTPRPKTQWEIQYGEAIARAANGLLANANSYYVWGAQAEEDYRNPPPRHPPEPGDTWWNYGQEIDVHQTVGRRTPIVCADVVALSYEGGGLSLYAFTGWAKWGLGERWATDPTRSVPALGVLLRDHGRERQWGGGALPELGDMVLSESYMHSAVVAEILGNDASQIFVIQASYSRGVVNKVSLADWQSGTRSHFVPS